MALAKIVFASMTGNTEEIADIVADKLRDLGLDVDVDECTTVDASDFLEADIAIVATYTYGDGELPDEMMDFYEDLADLNLNGKSTEWLAQEIPSTMNSVRLLMTLTVSLCQQEQKKVQSVLKLIFLLRKKTLSVGTIRRRIGC